MIRPFIWTWQDYRIHNGQWRWPDEWINQFPMLQSIGQGQWEDLRDQGNKVDWYEVVWFSNFIPRHAFILWLLVNERLPTQDRLSKWYPNKEMKCALCSTMQDSHQHLFFKCQYSSLVWEKAVTKVKISKGNDDWKEVLECLKALPCRKNIWVVVKKMVLAATIYFLWQKRNIRQFQNEKRPWEELWKIIEDTVKLKLSSLKVVASSNVKEIGWKMKLRLRIILLILVFNHILSSSLILEDLSFLKFISIDGLIP
ncbi:reverse transcriptase zinc-binding domain-containing protein [Tanacetum coccineum]